MILPFLDRLRYSARKRRQDPTHANGKYGEDLAHRFLQHQGMIIAARNWKTRSGTAEIDIVAHEGPVVVCVEVKTRLSSSFGMPERAVDPEKRRKLMRAAAEYARRTDTPFDFMRFDVVSVMLTEPPQITYFRDAFRFRSEQTRASDYVAGSGLPN